MNISYLLENKEENTDSDGSFNPEQINNCTEGEERESEEVEDVGFGGDGGDGE